MTLQGEEFRIIVEVGRGISEELKTNIEDCFKSLSCPTIKFSVVFIFAEPLLLAKVVKELIPDLVISLFNSNTDYSNFCPHFIIPYDRMVGLRECFLPVNSGTTQFLTTPWDYIIQVRSLGVEIGWNSMREPYQVLSRRLLCAPKDFSKKENQLSLPVIVEESSCVLMSYDVFRTSMNLNSRFVAKCKDIGIIPVLGGEMFIRLLFEKVLGINIS